MDLTSERAARLGIETQYHDARGQQRKADPEALARVLAAVAGRDQPARAQSSGKERIEEAPLPGAPRPAAYQGPKAGPRRLWALAVQLYGVRSRRNWGHGDFTDLAGLLDLAAELGAAGIALNPLHALFDDRAEAASPYSPNSRLFLNPLYIDVEAIPEFPGLGATGLQHEVAELRQRDLVDHAGVARAKARALALAYESFGRADAARREAFESFRRERGPVLTRFACFEFLRRRLGKPWPEWPEQWRNPADADLAALRDSDGDAIAFFEFVQWVADAQLQACRRRARDLGLPIGLYLDVAVGVQPEGFDAWSDQDSVMAGLAVGAPPDPFNTAGQNWGLAAFNPVALELQQFRPFRAMLQASMRYAGAIRLDHVLGLNRLFLIPAGMRPDQGVYVRFPFEALLAVTAEESVRHRCIVIGEDLGTVPDDFRATLSDWGIWSYQVMLFERAHDGSFLPPESYRENALVTFSTHDLATFAGWTSRHDLALKRALNMDPGETDEERKTAQVELQRALSARGATDLDFPAVARFLAQTPARLLVVAIEDALGVRDQANIPATIDEHPNWRRRLPVNLEDLRQQAGLRAVADVMASAGRTIRAMGADRKT